MHVDARIEIAALDARDFRDFQAVDRRSDEENEDEKRPNNHAVFLFFKVWLTSDVPDLY